jgi:hypothetical protein
MKAIAGGVLLCMSLLTISSQAQAIYKCVIHDAITYQQIPCEAPAPAQSASSNMALIGEWHLDHDATMAWTKHHAPMAKDKEVELDGFAGHLTYKFTKGLISWELTDYDVNIDGRVLHRKGSRYSSPYTIVSATPQTVTVSAQDPDTLSMYTTDVHFEGRDTMWLSLANQRLTAVDDANARAYFVRVH